MTLGGFNTVTKRFPDPTPAKRNSSSRKTLYQLYNTPVFPLPPPVFTKVSRVQPAVVMPLDADEEEVTFSTAPDTAPPQPYLQYGPDDSAGGGDKGLGSGAGDGAGGGTWCTLWAIYSDR